MIILPKFLFLFQTIPIFIPKSFFKELDRLTSIFIWNKKIPRIRKEFLERRREEGGLAMPNYMYFYWAANLYKLIFWGMSKKNENIPLWAIMEQDSYISGSLASVVSSPLPLDKKLIPNNPVILGSLKIWQQFRIHFKHKQGLLSAPIVTNVLFPPSFIDSTFQVWANKGIDTLKKLFNEGHFLSFEQLQEKFNLPSSDFFRYLQVRSFVKKHFSPSLQTPPGSWIDECLTLDPSKKGVISYLYHMFNTAAAPSLEIMKKQWQKELGLEITGTQWEQITKFIHKSSICIRHGLIQFKVVHRLHISNSKLARIFPGTDDTCPRCRCETGTLTHMFWGCKSFQAFWGVIFDSLAKAWNIKILPNPLTALFGVTPQNCKVTTIQASALAYSTPTCSS
uniref:Reverse transcriptase zinc-binding domain-containing protein n=1 Tax=Oryzias latipes TaxID=8090 RepID=A0A3P9J6K5_ORYLA